MGNHNTNWSARANIFERIRLIGIAYEASNLIFPSIEEETNRLRLSVWRWFNDNNGSRHQMLKCVSVGIWEREQGRNVQRQCERERERER